MAIARNSIYSLVPTVVGIALSILTVPFYISLVGTDRYGALLIAWVLLGYFGQADFGLGRAISQRLSAMPGADQTERAEVVWSALLGASVIATIGAVLVSIAANVFFGSFFDATEELRAEALSSTWLFALCIPVIMYTGVSSGALMGIERFGVVSIGSTLGSVVAQLLPLAVAIYHSVDLSWLLGASLVGRAVGLLPVMASMWQQFLRGQPANPSSAQLRRLFTYGSWIMVTAIVGPLMIMSDRVMIGAAIGAAAVVAYSVPFQIAQRTTIIPYGIVQALFPRLASQEEHHSIRLSQASLVFIGQLYAPLILGLICLAGPLLTLWLGKHLDPRSTLIAQIVLAGFWVNALANVPYTLIQARGNPRFTALLHVSELPLYALMLFVLSSYFGLAGAAAAFAIRCLIDCIVLMAKGGLWTRDILLKLCGPAVLVMAALAFCAGTTAWLYSLVAATVFCLLAVMLALAQMPDEVERSLRASQVGRFVEWPLSLVRRGNR